MISRGLLLALPLLMLVSSPARANEGVLFSYTLEEQVAADDVTTSEFGFLIHFDKEASADIGGTAKLDVVAHDRGDSVHVNLRLNDYVDGALALVGTTTLTIPYGATQSVTWAPPNLGTYTLSVQPERHVFQ